MIMAITKADNQCKRIRKSLYGAARRHLGWEAGWLQSHISRCPRCRRRLVSLGRVNLALSLIKARPHSLHLLMRANQQAIAVLKHSLRVEPKAAKLKTSLPEPRLAERCGRYGQSLGHWAACAAVLLLMKMGVFSSMDSFQTEGQEVMKQYYTRQVGQELAEDVFPAQTLTCTDARTDQHGQSSGSPWQSVFRSGNPRGTASV